MAKDIVKNPSAVDVATAFANLNPVSTREMLVSFIENVLASGAPVFDLHAIFGSIPKSTFFLRVSPRRPICRIVNPPSRIAEVVAGIGIGLLMLAFPATIAIMYLLTYFVEIPNDFRFEYILAPFFIGFMVCALTSMLFNVKRRTRVAVPQAVYDVLLSILPKARARRRKWISVKIAVKLVGAGLFDHVAEAIASEEFAKALANLMDMMADNAVERYMDKDLERFRLGLLAQAAPIPVGINPAHFDWKAILECQISAAQRYPLVNRNGTPGASEVGAGREQ